MSCHCCGDTAGPWDLEGYCERCTDCDVGNATCEHVVVVLPEREVAAVLLALAYATLSSCIVHGGLGEAEAEPPSGDALLAVIEAARKLHDAHDAFVNRGRASAVKAGAPPEPGESRSESTTPEVECPRCQGRGIPTCVDDALAADDAGAPEECALCAGRGRIHPDTIPF